MLTIAALAANAQAYEFEYELINDVLTYHFCRTRLFKCVNGGTAMRLHLANIISSNHNNHVALRFQFFDSNLRKDDPSIQIRLANNDILSSKDLSGKDDGRGIILYQFLSIDTKVNNVQKDNNGAYVMSLLRTYNIVSISIGGTTINTPNMRSADTFDAMCKMLISKTGDQGQYGKRLVGGNNSSNKQSSPAFVTKRIAKPNIKTVVTNAKGVKVNRTKLNFVPNQVFNGNSVIKCILDVEFVGEYRHDYRPFIYIYKDNRGTPLSVNGHQVYTFTDQISYYKKDGSYGYYGYGHNNASASIYYQELDPNINTFYARLWLYDETDKKYIGCSDYYTFTRNGNTSVIPSKNNSNNASNAQKPRPATSTPSINRTQQNSTKPNISTSQSKTKNVDLNKTNATTLKKEAEKGNHEAMYILGCRYHDGQLAGIEKNDRLSYQWLMTYCHVSNEKDGEKALKYIKNNLQKNYTTLKPSYEYLTKETDQTPMDFILHPLTYFPTSSIFMKEADMEREIATKKQMKIYTSSKKKYDKGVIEIWENDNRGKMPKLIKKEVWKMEWRSKNTKYAHYNYDFKFGNRNEAEKFFYTIAYETMQEDVFWEKLGSKTQRKLDEDVALNCTSYLTINGKGYVVHLYLYIFDNKAAKPEERYTVAIEVSLLKKK